MEAKNLRGRESENRRIWSREFNIDFFTRVGYADIRNRGATGKRLVPLQCYRSNRVLGGRAVTSFCCTFCRIMVYYYWRCTNGRRLALPCEGR